VRHTSLVLHAAFDDRQPVHWFGKWYHCVLGREGALYCLSVWRTIPQISVSTSITSAIVLTAVGSGFRRQTASAEKPSSQQNWCGVCTYTKGLLTVSRHQKAKIVVVGLANLYLMLAAAQKRKYIDDRTYTMLHRSIVSSRDGGVMMSCGTAG
jgi:hypothetical protein